MNNQKQNQPNRSEKAVDICPRCGKEVSWYEEHRRGNRKYVYAAHYIEYRGGKARVRKCYLGPVDSYRYVSRMHEPEGLEFYGLLNRDRIFEYAMRLLDSLPSAAADLDPAKLSSLIGRMEKTLEELKGIRSKSRK